MNSHDCVMKALVKMIVRKTSHGHVLEGIAAKSSAITKLKAAVVNQGQAEGHFNQTTSIQETGLLTEMVAVLEYPSEYIHNPSTAMSMVKQQYGL